MTLSRSSLNILLLVGFAAASEPSWTIYHSWNGSQEYSKRGILRWSLEEESLVVENDEGALTPDSIQAMLDYGWYHVKIENPGGDFVMATVPACTLRRANFKDEFQVILPRTSEHITSFAYNPLVSPLAPPSCEDLPIPESPSLKSRTQVALDTPGMVLKTILPNTKPAPGLTFIPNPNRKGKAGEGGPGGPNAEDATPPSFVNDFLKKYWYILLPLFIMNFMVPPEEPQPSEGGAAAQGEASAPPPSGDAASTAAASSAAQSKRARRGKRG